MPHTILEGIEGQGQYVGTYIAWGVNSNGWWGEGEIKFYLDDDTDYPTICGTGTEDYFGGAWNFDVPGKGYTEFSTPYLGMPQVIRPDGLYVSQQRFGMYRWHLLDPIHFATGIPKVDIQALGWRSGWRYLPLRDDIASTALFYLDRPTARRPEDADGRRPGGAPRNRAGARHRRHASARPAGLNGCALDAAGSRSPRLPRRPRSCCDQLRRRHRRARRHLPRRPRRRDAPGARRGCRHGRGRHRRRPVADVLVRRRRPLRGQRRRCGLRVRLLRHRREPPHRLTHGRGRARGRGAGGRRRGRPGVVGRGLHPQAHRHALRRRDDLPRGAGPAPGLQRGARGDDRPQ